MSNWKTLSLPSIAKTKFVNKVLIAKTSFANKVLQQSLCERIVPILPECIMTMDILTDWGNNSNTQCYKTEGF